MFLCSQQRNEKTLTSSFDDSSLKIANYLASQGYRLLLISRNLDKLKLASNEIAKLNPQTTPSEIADADVSDYDKVKKLVESFIEETGRVDLLCNSAGYVKRGSSDLDPNEFLKMINTNLLGTFNLIEIVSPFMTEV